MSKKYITADCKWKTLEKIMSEKLPCDNCEEKLTDVCNDKCKRFRKYYNKGERPYRPKKEKQNDTI